jgi:amino acid transporter
MGFEIFTTVTKNIQNPTTNISKSIARVLLSAIVFYLLFTILFFGSVGDFQGKDDPIVYVINQVFWS